MSREIINEKGNRYGRWFVLGYGPTRPGSTTVYWSCICDCGTERVLAGTALRHGDSKSCGCVQKEEVIDLTDKRYDRLLVISRAPKQPGSTAAHWCCDCSCGNKCIVRGANLRNGNTQSCGCLHVEIVSKRLGKKHPGYKTGDGCNISTKKQRTFYAKIRARDNYICQDCGILMCWG